MTSDQTPEAVEEETPVDDEDEALSVQVPDGTENPYNGPDFNGDQDVPDEELPDA